MNVGATNRAQHYVPQLYLKWFVDPTLESAGKEHLWVYEKGKHARPSSPKEVAHQRDFYAFEHEGERNNMVDEYLQKVESSGTEARLREFALSGTLPDGDKVALAIFIGTLSARVPTARTLADDIAGEQPTEQLMRYVDSPLEFRAQFEAMHLNVESSLSAEEIRLKLKEGYRFQQANDIVNLRMVLDMAKKNWEGLLSLDWCVLQSDSDFRFVTSDNPVVSLLPERGGEARLGRSMAEPRIEVIFPLNPFACLFAKRGAVPGIHRVPGSKVRKINKVVMAMAERWVFASEFSTRLSRVFDAIGSTGLFGDNFYSPDPNILKRTPAPAASIDDELNQSE